MSQIGAPIERNWAKKVTDDLESLYASGLSWSGELANLSFESHDGNTPINWRLSGPGSHGMELDDTAHGGSALWLHAGRELTSASLLELQADRPTLIRFALRTAFIEVNKEPVFPLVSLSVRMYTNAGESEALWQPLWSTENEPMPYDRWRNVTIFLDPKSQLFVNQPDARFLEFRIQGGQPLKKGEEENSQGKVYLDNFAIRMLDPASPTLLVAAANSPARVRALADFVCDGKGDAAVLQTAINSVAAGGGKGCLQLAEGDYHLIPATTAAVLSLPSNVEVHGVGDSSRLLVAENAQSVITTLVFAIDPGNQNIRVSNLAIECPAAVKQEAAAFEVGGSSQAPHVENVVLEQITLRNLNTTTSKKAIVQVNNGHRFVLRNCAFVGCFTNSTHASVVISGGTGNRVLDCTFRMKAGGGSALRLEGDTEGGIIKGNNFDCPDGTAPTAMWIGGANRFNVSKNQLIGFETGVHIARGQYNLLTGNFIRRCKCGIKVADDTKNESSGRHFIIGNAVHELLENGSGIDIRANNIVCRANFFKRSGKTHKCLYLGNSKTWLEENTFSDQINAKDFERQNTYSTTAHIIKPVPSVWLSSYPKVTSGASSASANRKFAREATYLVTWSAEVSLKFREVNVTGELSILCGSEVKSTYSGIANTSWLPISGEFWTHGEAPAEISYEVFTVPPPNPRDSRQNTVLVQNFRVSVMRVNPV